MDNPSASFTELPQPYPTDTKQPKGFNDIPAYAAEPPNYVPPPYYPAPSAPYPTHTVLPSNNAGNNFNGFTYVGADGQPVLDFTRAFVLAAFVYFCCCCLFGIAAFIIAMIGHNDSSRNRANAAQLMRASYGVSIAGIVVGAMATVAIVVLYYYLYFKDVDWMFSTTKYPMRLWP